MSLALDFELLLRIAIFYSMLAPVLMCFLLNHYPNIMSTCFDPYFTEVVQLVKNLPAMQETHVQSLGQEDPMEKEMTTHSSILAWRIPWTEEPGRL